MVDETIDLLDNPYIRVNAFRMSEDFLLKDSEKIKLRKCTIEDLTAFMSERTAGYYPNSLCFADRSKVEIEGNWFEKSFKTIQLTVEECIGEGCKSRDEIASFMKTNLFYFLSQNTIVSPEIYYTEAIKLGLENIENYFPLLKRVNSGLYQSLPYDKDSPL